MSTSEPIFAVCAHTKLSDPRSHTGERLLSHFKSDVIVANANLELLLSNDVLFRPVRVIFPFCGGDQSHTPDGVQWLTNFVISLASTILFNSFTINGPIHTARARGNENVGKEGKENSILSFLIRLSLR